MYLLPSVNTVIDVTEILVHWHAGRSISEVSESLGLDRKTIRKYIAPAVDAGMVPGDPALSLSQWAVLVRDWFPGLDDTSLRQVTWPEIAVHHEYIVDQLKAGVTKATIHQRLRDEKGLRASLASFKRYVAGNMSEEERRDRVVVLRDTSHRAMKHRSTTAGSVCGPTRRPGAAERCGRS